MLCFYVLCFAKEAKFKVYVYLDTWGINSLHFPPEYSNLLISSWNTEFVSTYWKASDLSFEVIVTNPKYEQCAHILRNRVTIDHLFKFLWETWKFRGTFEDPYFEELRHDCSTCKFDLEKWRRWKFKLNTVSHFAEICLHFHIVTAQLSF